MKYRDRSEVISLILQVANGACDAATTKIMNRALLSYKQMKEHLIFLTRKDLLYYDKVSGTFKTTEKGLRFLQIYSQMEDMIKTPPLHQQRRRQQAGI
jgi:predicted transcriptional regulator